MAGRTDGENPATEEIRFPGDRPGSGHEASSEFEEEELSEADLIVQRRQESARRQRRQSLTFLTLFALILLLGVLALAAYFQRITLPFGSGRPAALPTCPTASPTLLTPGEVSVHVFNASTRNGLALSVARELQGRGFLIPSSPANDPHKTKVTTMAVIRHGPDGLLAAQTVATIVDGEVTYAEDDRTGTDVDLVLGGAFKLVPKAAPSASPSAVAPAPTPTCQPAS